MGLTHIRKRSDFKAAAEQGRRFRASGFAVQIRDRAEIAEIAQGAGLRLGLTASRKTGTATERNRIRRRLRAAAEQALAPNSERAVDVVVIARREALSMDFAAIRAELEQSLIKARAPKPNPNRTPSGPAGRPRS